MKKDLLIDDSMCCDGFVAFICNMTDEEFEAYCKEQREAEKAAEADKANHN